MRAISSVTFGAGSSPPSPGFAPLRELDLDRTDGRLADPA
jgi:hypothetical protein